MRTIALTALTALLVGCSGEYTINPDEPVFGIDNPRDLETPVNEDRIVQVTVPETDVLDLLPVEEQHCVHRVCALPTVGDPDRLRRSGRCHALITRRTNLQQPSGERGT
jgi:hypothetical protein